MRRLKLAFYEEDKSITDVLLVVEHSVIDLGRTSSGRFGQFPIFNYIGSLLLTVLRRY